MVRPSASEPESAEPPSQERAFQVDLRGVVDLLSHHLYTSPRVYVRELLQNAVDAVSAGHMRESGHTPPGCIRIETSDSPVEAPDGKPAELLIHDNGVGLTETEVHELLATIGRSSKRDDLGFARGEFLGQFGIGLLSCFLVADEVRVLTRSAHGGPTVAWTGFSDGRYQVGLPEQQRLEPGTTVSLVPRPGMRSWLDNATVTQLATEFGSLLPVQLTVGGRDIHQGEPPWRVRYANPADRRAALIAYAERLFGFEPYDVIDLYVPQAGLSGVAFVLPMSASPSARNGHRVYLRRMLLSANVDKLLPDWAFFIRGVVDTQHLRPTASREELYEDDLLADTRDALGAQIRDWLVRLAATEPARLQKFLSVHHLGVKAMAMNDLEMLRIVDQWWPMETNLGPMTLAEFRRRYPEIRYTATSDQFRELASVAAAQNVGLVNGGYAYDIELMKRLHLLDRAIRVRTLEPTELATHFLAPGPAADHQLAPLIRAAATVLEPLGCVAAPLAFDPPSLPALYLVNRKAIQTEEMRAAREAAEGSTNPLWSGVLSTFAEPVSPEATSSGTADLRPQLVMNLRSPVVRRMMDLVDPGLAGLAVQALYGQALLHGQHPLKAADSAVLNQSFLGLLDWAMSAPASDPGPTSHNTSSGEAR